MFFGGGGGGGEEGLDCSFKFCHLYLRLNMEAIMLVRVISDAIISGPNGSYSAKY